MPTRKRKRSFMFVILVCTVLLLSGYVSLQTQIGREKLLSADEGIGETHTVLEEPVQWAVDMNDLASNIGRVIYDDGQCQIGVKDFYMLPDGDYQIVLRCDGKFGYHRGRIVALSEQTRVDKLAGRLDVLMGDTRYTETRPHAQYRTASGDDQGVEYVLSVFPVDCFLGGELTIKDEIDSLNGKVMLELTALVETQWFPVK